MKLFFWMKEQNFHWVDTLKSLYPMVNDQIVIVVQNDISERRKTIGWSEKKEPEFETIRIPKNGWFQTAKNFLRTNQDAIHIFSGFAGEWLSIYFFPLIIYSLILNIRTGLIVEPYSISPHGYYQDESNSISMIKVKTRPLMYRLSAALINLFNRNQKLCLLPISLIAKNQLIQAGFREEDIFPFGYFVKKDSSAEIVSNLDEGITHLVYMGSLHKIKGVDLVIDALSEINRAGIFVLLDVFGPGQLHLSSDYQHQFISYCGVVPQKTVQAVISKYDLLILPSRHDGWGVVVNEALLQGVPVIVSDRVGACCLVDSTGSGLVFTSDDRNDLIKKIKSILEDKSSYQLIKKNAQEVGEKISPQNAAKYLFEVLNFFFLSDRSGQKPSAIWCGKEVKDSKIN